MNHGLSAETVTRIGSMLGSFPQVEKAVLYGSRAKGNYRKGSDIDLALIGAHLDWNVLGDVMEALDELSLPYKMDVSIFALLKHAALIEHIERVGVPLYERAAAAV